MKTAIPPACPAAGDFPRERGLPARNVASEMPPPPGCRECGICCFSPSATYVRVTGADWTRLGGAAEKFAHFIGHRAYMRMQDGHCAALECRRDVDGRLDYFCTLYERRPQLCRDLERGSPACEAERDGKSRRQRDGERRCGGG